jgi:carbon-monoxide dehydrogenase medium subunit
VKPPAFGYVRPETLEEALEFLADHEGAAVLAGGQSLITTLNMRLASPEYLVDINRIECLSHLTQDGDEVVVGALVRHAEVAASRLILDHVPIVAKAMEHVAHPAIRNRGTCCGSLAYADPAAEMPPCAFALDARLVLANRSERRTVAARDFFMGVYETARRQDELLIEVRFPIARPQEYFGFAELTRRHGDFALVGTAIRAQCQRRRIQALDIVVFAAVPNLLVSKAATRLAAGREWSTELVEAVASGVAEEMEPMENLQGRSETKRLQGAALLRRELNKRMAEVDRAAG